ncbi:MAG: hypothetical protein IPG90_15015 [Bacteroidetes bacterium]|nr:hypothetical protein [Bacteroidota bacterium]
MRKTPLSSLLLLLFVLQLACKKENDRPQWDVAVKGPILKASLTLDNLIADSLQHTNPDGSLSIVFDSDVFKLDPDSLFKIPDTTLNTLNIWQFITYPVQPNTPFYSVNNNIQLGISGPQLTEVAIRSGKIKLDIRNTLPSKVIIIYQIPKAIKNGLPFKVQEVIDSGSITNPTLFSGTYDLDGYLVDLTGATGNQFNTAYYDVQAISDPQGNAFDIHTGDTLINLNTTILELIPEYGRGYLGQKTIHQSGNSLAGIGQTIRSGMVELDSVTLDLDIENGLGAEIQAMISSFSSLNENTGNSVGLVAPGVLNRFINMNRATETGQFSDPVRPTHAYIHLDNSNSNLIQLIENLPDRFFYDIDFSLNPLGNVSGSNDFLYRDHLVNTHMVVNVPLRFALNQVFLVDTQEIATADLLNLDPVGLSTFTLLVDNGFPFALDLQLFLINESGSITDSLLVPSQIAMANVDVNFRVLSSVRTKIPIPVDGLRKQHLLEARKMAIKAKFTSPSYPSLVQMYADYHLDLKLIADGIYSIR